MPVRFRLVALVVIAARRLLFPLVPLILLPTMELPTSKDIAEVKAKQAACEHDPEFIGHGLYKNARTADYICKKCGKETSVVIGALNGWNTFR